MATYNQALQQQAGINASQEKADSIIPDKNACPLIVTTPYSPSASYIQIGAKWADTTEVFCDSHTMNWLFDHSIESLCQNFPAFGVSVHDAKYSRFLLDLDRKKNSYNPDYTDRPDMGIIPDDDDFYAANGTGVIWMRLPGDTETPLFMGDYQPTKAQIDDMLLEYDAYHEVLEKLITTHMDRFGASLHISIQQFSREEAVMLGADPDDIPQFVLCDGGGQTTERNFLEKLSSVITSKGYKVERNNIFPTGELTQNHASRDNGAYSIQLKVFEELYLNPDTLQNATGYKKFSRDIHAIMMTMAEYARSCIRKSQPTASVSNLSKPVPENSGSKGDKGGPKPV